MSKLLSLLGGNATVIGGGVAVAGVVAVGIYASGVLQNTAKPTDQPVVSPPAAARPVAKVPVAQDPGPAQSSAQGTTGATETAVKPVVSDPGDPAVAAIYPSFDLVRVETDGTTLIAGQGASDAGIAILMDGQEIGMGQTNAAGKFVAFLTLEISDKPRVLTLVQRRAGGDWTSQASVILAPSVQVVAEAATTAAPKQPGSEIAMTAQTPAPVPAAMAQPSPQGQNPNAAPKDPALAAGSEPPAARPLVQSQPATQDAAVAPPQPQPQPKPQTDPARPAANSAATVATATTPKPSVDQPAASPTVLLADESGVRVLQAPVAAGAGPEVMSAVALDAISYSDSGEVALSGRGKGDGFVRVYLDNAPVTTSRISTDGNWRTELPEVDTGIYTLRVDEVTAEGAVISRVETPFKREDQGQLEQAAATQSDMPAQVITVQPGWTLWAIAREAYGEGELYVRVYQANRDRIRDPDLIYPGQVFAMPGQ